MAELVARSGTDPSASGADIAWQTPDSTGVFSRKGELTRLTGTHPALGGGLVGERRDGAIHVARLDTGVELNAFPDAGAGSFAISSSWLVVRERGDREDRLVAISLADGSRRDIATVRLPGQLGRPALDGDTLVYHEATTKGTVLREVDLRSGRDRLLRRRRGAVLLNPSIREGRLVYVHATFERQRLRLGQTKGDRDGSDDRTIYDIAPTARRDSGHESGRHLHGAGYPGGRAPRRPARPRPGVTRTLWTTALEERDVLVARLRHKDDGVTDSVLLRVEVD